MTNTIFLIATGKYKSFLHQAIAGIENYWTDTKIVIFTDEPSEAILHDQYKIDHNPWPYPTLYRFHYFVSVMNDIDTDYVYYVDVDARFIDEVEVQGDLVAVRHCGFYFGGNVPEETNTKSGFYAYKFDKYYGGGFFGGTKKNFYLLARWCRYHIDKDLDNGVIPVHNDETALNAYFSENEPTLELTPDYHYPEDTEYFIENCWNGTNPFTPRLLLLKKDHEKMRS